MAQENPRIIEILVQNQDKDIFSDIVATHEDIKRRDRKTLSGIGELSQVGQDAQGGVPPTQLEQGDIPPLQVEEGDELLEYEWLKLLFDRDLEERLRFLSNWKLSPDRRSICRTFQARNFSEGMKFLNAVVKLAEEEGHPLDLHLTEFRKVTVVLMTQKLQGVSGFDILMAERINCIDVQYAEPAEDIDNFPQGFHSSQEPERPPSQDSEDLQLENCPQQLVLQSSPAAEPQSKESNRINFTESSADGREADQDTATRLHSLILVYADAGAGGHSIHEAVRRITKHSLPGLKEKANTV